MFSTPEQQARYELWRALVELTKELTNTVRIINKDLKKDGEEKNKETTHNT